MRKTLKNLAIAVIAVAVMAAYVPIAGSTALGAEKFDAGQKVKNLSVVSASYDRVRIGWSSQKGAKGYQIYRAAAPGGKYSRIRTTGSTSYINRGLSLKDRYYYKVRAYSKKKGKTVYGKFSKTLAASPELKSPENFTAKAAGSTSVALQWSRVAGAKYYEVFRYDASGRNYSCKSYDCEYSDSGLDPDTTYYYKVRACTDLEGKVFRSAFAGGETREIVLNKALSWFGLMEYDRSNQPIIDIYNEYFYDKYGWHTGYDYTIPWCAIYVSAVVLETDTEDIIPVHEDCPDMMDLFEKKVVKPEVNSYIPEPADVVFYDWISSETGELNGRADHVGIIVTASEDEIKAVEGNKTIKLASGEETDAVAYRVFTPDFDSLLAYGLPQYPETKATTSAVENNGPEVSGNASAAENPVTDEDVEAAVDAVEKSRECRKSVQDGGDDTAKVKALVEYIQTEKPGEKSDAEESTFDAYMIMKACNEMGIDACAVINVDKKGNEMSWAEVTLEGETFMVDPAASEDEFVKVVPEKIN